jgi:hypothetical protein
MKRTLTWCLTNGFSVNRRGAVRKALGSRRM